MSLAALHNSPRPPDRPPDDVAQHGTDQVMTPTICSWCVRLGLAEDDPAASHTICEFCLEALYPEDEETT